MTAPAPSPALQTSAGKSLLLDAFVPAALGAASVRRVGFLANRMLWFTMFALGWRTSSDTPRMGL